MKFKKGETLTTYSPTYNEGIPSNWALYIKKDPFL